MRILDSDSESRVEDEGLRDLRGSQKLLLLIFVYSTREDFIGIVDRTSSSTTPTLVDQIVKGININVNADFPLSRFPPPMDSVSIPEQSFGDEPFSNVRTPEGRQPAAQEPPPVDPGMGSPQRRYTSMGYAQPASSPMGGFAYSPTWGTRGPPPGPVPQLDMESASNAGGRVSGQVAAIERIQGENADPLTVRQKEKLPERRVSPAASEQSRASSRKLPTPPVQSLNPPPPRRGSSLSSLLKSPAMNMPNWERTHTIHHSRTNFPVQPLSEMTL
ncbi:hypothetical protein EV368DRAFT_88360 [Lentinula lateritia]|nr:hypothetical protein EV368DRAFT_88360 [Lentinula lateritia]